MAQLWVATNEATGAEVCVKILVPETSDDESVERFRREAYAAARLSHRAIVRIFDLVELGANGETTTTGKPTALAIVMELLHGETLGDMLMKQGKLSVDETIDLALPFLSALAHAHRAGVVHRDLKPDNIFLARDPDGHVIPKVLDFGVSKMNSSDRPAANAKPITLEGVMLGTPSFMSPEQARGSREIDARSDVFSAGTLIYLMLAGKNPFESESFHSVVSAIIHREVPRLTAVPDAIWDVLAKALSKDPAVRYPDATELGIALRRATGRTSPTDSGPQSTPGSVPSAARVLAAPLGGDSIVTVPPVGNAELGDAPPESPAQSVPASRRRALRIVSAVLGASVLLVLVALLKSPSGSASATTATSEPPSASTATATATATPPPPATATATATAERAPPPIAAAADAGAPNPLPRAAGTPKPPPPSAATTTKTPYDDDAPPKEPSIVRDPGF